MQMSNNAKPFILGNSVRITDDAPYWENAERLYLDGDLHRHIFQTDRLDEFPLIEDFEVHLSDTGYDHFGYHIDFFSRSRGYIASFPWWDHAEVDLLQENFQIRIGDFQKAFIDLEQSWIICIAAQPYQLGCDPYIGVQKNKH